MDLAAFLATVENSVFTDWHKMNVTPVVAVYKPDIDISLAFACNVTDPFTEPWTQRFPDSHASSVQVWLRYKGQVVSTLNCVLVDGARYLVPLPEIVNAGGYRVPTAKMPMAELLFQLYGPAGVHTTAADALQHAQVAIV